MKSTAEKEDMQESGSGGEKSQIIEAQKEEIAHLKASIAEKTAKLEAAETDLRVSREDLFKTGELLRQSEASFRELLDNAMSGVVIVQDQYIKFCNQAYCDMVGYSKEELYAEPFDCFLHEDDKTTVLDRHFRRMQGEKPEEEYDLRLIAKDGKTIWGHIKIVLQVPLDDKQAIVAFVDNLTEQRKTEIALKESEARYRLYISKMLNGFTHNRMICDDQGQPVDFETLEVNESYLRTTKLKREDIVGVPISTVIPEVKSVKPDLIQYAARVALKGESFVREFYFGTFNRWFEISAYSTRSGYFNAVYKDVTLRKRAETELEQSKAYLEYSLNSAPEGVLLVDTDLRLTYVNPAFTNLFGIDKSKIIGKTTLELAPKLLSQKDAEWIHYDIINQIRTKAEVSVGEFDLKHPDGMMIPAQFSISAIRDQKDEVIGFVAFIKNILERRRTQELMIQTEKMMSVGGLAAGMAHEINNPLGGMLQGTQNIIRRLSPDLEANHKDAQLSGLDLDKLAEYIKRRKIDDMLEGILSSGRRAARIITNMLQFSRQSESKFCPNDINALIDDALELSANDYDLVKKFDFRKIEIEKRYDEQLPLVACTKTEIEQVILNLLKNAAQAMMLEAREHVPKIAIRTAIDGSYVCIEVRDNGPGLEPDILKRVFEPFFTTKPVGMGTGLGLSVSYMIITNNHNGLMEVRSEPGKGACFIIRLPQESRAVS